MLLKSEFWTVKFFRKMPSARSARITFSFVAVALDQDVVGLSPGALDLDVALRVADAVAVGVAHDRDQVLRVRAAALILVGEREVAARRCVVDVLAAGRGGGPGSEFSGRRPGRTRIRVPLVASSTARWML